MNPITYKIIEWYVSNKRELPWRGLKDPYKVWVSEIILQQTRIVQGIQYYHDFLNSFPDIQSLARASIEEVLKVWQGLGYYSRARNMHETAAVIVDELGGEFPENELDLIKLKGIGAYTANAIASICFDRNVPAIDGNVNRVIARLFAINDPIDRSAGQKKIRTVLNDLIEGSDAGEFNQAMMDFGSLQCVAANPDCSICPVSQHCYGKSDPGLYPVLSKAASKRMRFFHYIIIYSKNGETKFIIRKRISNDIWQGLYDFPCIETAGDIGIEQLDVMEFLKSSIGISGVIIKTVSPYHKHILTHQLIRARFIYVEAGLKGSILKESSLQLIGASEYPAFPIPRLIDRHFNPLQLPA